MLQDLRYAFRMLCKNPAFTAVAVLILALGIGANSAIFSVGNAVLLRPLPYADSHRLVKVWETNPRSNRWGQWVSYPDFADWRRQNQVFEDMAAFRIWVWTITGGEYPETLPGFLVTSNLFSLLGVEPMFGRSPLPEEDQPGGNPVVILSYGLWQRRFGSDPGLVGQTVTIEGQKHTVIGIMPPAFRFPLTFPAPQVWLTIAEDARVESPTDTPMTVVWRISLTACSPIKASPYALSRSVSDVNCCCDNNLVERHGKDGRAGLCASGLVEPEEPWHSAEMCLTIDIMTIFQRSARLLCVVRVTERNGCRLRRLGRSPEWPAFLHFAGSS